jgi:esterase/lipase
MMRVSQGALHMLSKFISVLMLFTIVLVVIAFVTAPAKLVNHPLEPEITSDLDAWLAAEEHVAGMDTPIIPGAEKHIHWFAGRKGSKSPCSVVYLHGFSATRQEIAPVAAMIADDLQANLFETRLLGHGLSDKALVDVRAEDWLADAAEALAIGAKIGQRIILMGTSTGATLALAMAGQPSFEHVAALILVSPNFAPRDAAAKYLTWPGGPQLAYLVAGTTRSWTPANELQKRYWSTTYPMDAVVEMMRLVKYVRGELPQRLEQSLLMIYSPADNVVDTGQIISAYSQIDSPQKELIRIPTSGDPSNHVLAGDILSPQNNQAVADDVVRFIIPHGDRNGYCASGLPEFSSVH